MKKENLGIEAVLDRGARENVCDAKKDLYIEAAHVLRDHMYKRRDGDFDQLKNVEKIYETLWALSDKQRMCSDSEETEKLLSRYGSEGKFRCGQQPKSSIELYAMELAYGLYEIISRYAERIKSRLTETDYRLIFRIVTSSPKEFPDLSSKIGSDVNRVGDCIRGAGAVETLTLVERLGRKELLWRYNNCAP